MFFGCLAAFLLFAYLLALASSRCYQPISQINRTICRFAFLKAVDNQDFECTLCLLRNCRQFIDPSIDGNVALEIACMHGQIDLANMLLKDHAVRPNFDESLLVNMGEMDRLGIGKLLLRDGRIKFDVGTLLMMMPPSTQIHLMTKLVVHECPLYENLYDCRPILVDILLYWLRNSKFEINEAFTTCSRCSSLNVPAEFLRHADFEVFFEEIRRQMMFPDELIPCIRDYLRLMILAKNLGALKDIAPTIAKHA